MAHNERTGIATVVRIFPNPGACPRAWERGEVPMD